MKQRIFSIRTVLLTTILALFLSTVPTQARAYAEDWINWSDLPGLYEAAIVGTTAVATWYAKPLLEGLADQISDWYCDAPSDPNPPKEPLL